MLAAFLADWYYLQINPYYEPHLFELQSDFHNELPPEWLEGLVKILREMSQEYRRVREEEQHRCEIIKRNYESGNYKLVQTLCGHESSVFLVALSVLLKGILLVYIQ